MDDLVQRLSGGDHPVIVSLRPNPTIAGFREALDRRYVHIKFPETRGGTELGVPLDPERCNLTDADFDRERGLVRIAGNLTLNYVPVRCVADIDLATLAGQGHLEVLS